MSFKNTFPIPSPLHNEISFIGTSLNASNNQLNNQLF